MPFDAIPFFANIALVVHADGTLSASELGQMEKIRKELRIKKSEYNTALRLVETGGYRLTPVGSFADQVKNLEYILRVAYADDELSKNEVSVILSFCKAIGINQDQLNRLRNEAVASLKQAGKLCPQCGTESPSDAIFCPKCGAGIASQTEAVQTQFQIPAKGIAIEFADSTAASFPKAVELAKGTSGYQTCQRGKKMWFLTTFATGQIMDALPLIECLSGLRNKTLYLDGEIKLWDEVFAFSGCAATRDTQLHPVEYCFGKTYNRLNPWGCQLAKMDWTGWADWFSYGQWEKSDWLGQDYQWRFDKKRIRHELEASLYRYRFCPYLKTELVAAVLRHFPEVAIPGEDSAWGYRTVYEETPGAIKIVQQEGAGSYVFTREFWSDGVFPKGLSGLNEILSMALRDLKMREPSLSSLLA